MFPSPFVRSIPLRHRLLTVGAMSLGASLILAGCSSTAQGALQASNAADISTCDPAETTLSTVFGAQAAEAMAIAAPALESKFPGLTIEAEPQQVTSYDDLTKTVVGDIAAGKRPDLVMSGLGQLRFWVDTYKPAEIDQAALSETYRTEFLSAGTVDDKVYLAPAQISAPVLLVNANLAADAAVNPEEIASLADLVAAAERITKETGKASVSLSTDALADWWVQALVQGAGSSLADESGAAAFDDASAVAALGIWGELAEVKAEANVGLQDALGMFIGGKLPMLVTTTSTIANVQQGIGGRFEWLAVDFPTLDGNAYPMPAGGNGWIVLSEDPCAAAFSNALVSELLSTQAVLAASGESFSYIPVDSAAADQLLSSAKATPQLTYAWSYDGELSPWGGFNGAKTVQINDSIKAMAQHLQAGDDTTQAVDEAVQSINKLIK